MNFSGDDFSEFLEETLDTVSGETEKPNKGGRPTIADNVLLGSRNPWKSFFEEFWHGVCGPLSQIRKRRSSTITDVQKVFEMVKGRTHGDLANVFLRGSPKKPSSAQELRKDRIASNKLRYELQDRPNQRQELQRSCSEAENALKQANTTDMPQIQEEFARRAELLRQHDEVSAKKERECSASDEQVRNLEVYLYCSELLDFLRSRRRSLNPLNLANALAGLPDMRWRQSNARCSKMPADSYVQHPYAVFKLIERLLRRINTKHGKSLADEFRAELMKLPQKQTYPRDFICQQWRDFRLAVEEVSRLKHQSGFVPAITSAFLKNVSRQKTSVDNVLDAQERLILKTK